MGRSRDQFGPEGPGVSTLVACRSPAVRDQAKGRRLLAIRTYSWKPRTEPIVRRLRAGGRWIRTIGPAKEKLPTDGSTSAVISSRAG
jgi:hypothetical protein